MAKSTSKKASAKKASAKKASVKKASVKKASVKNTEDVKPLIENTEEKKASVKKASVKKTHLLEHELAICKSNQEYINNNLEMFTNGSTPVSE